MQKPDERNTLEIFHLHASASQDMELLRKLRSHLNPLKAKGPVKERSSADIIPGMTLAKEISSYINSAHIILILMSADFFHPKHAESSEVQRALERHRTGEVHLIPIILRPVQWEIHPFNTFQVLPSNAIPITRWQNEDDAFSHIATKVEEIIQSTRWIYFSFSSHDQQFADQLKRSLQEHHSATIRFRTPESSSDSEAIHRAVRGASVFLLIVSPHTRFSTSVGKELTIATHYNKRIVPLWIEGATWNDIMPQGYEGNDYIDVRNSSNELVSQVLLERLQPETFSFFSSAKEAKSGNVSSNPYKALDPFHSEDAPYFFGRDTLLDELFQKMQTILSPARPSAHSARLLAVIGASGSGKSSVVQAGLLPLLQKGDRVSGSNDWMYLEPMRPDKHPINSLAIRLYRRPGREDITSIQTDLREPGAFNLHALSKALTPSHQTKVVLFIDQFEELFAETISEEEQKQFIDLLTVAVTQTDGPLIVILTLQTGFLPQLKYHKALESLVTAEANQVLVPPLSIEELHDIIEKPARLCHVTFDSDLVNALLLDMSRQPTALPLLQFTLFQLFEEHEGARITLDAYRKIGGIKKALANFAQDTFDHLPGAEHRRLARQLFLRLINPGTDGYGVTRQRIALEELSFPDSTHTAIIRSTADTFVRERLLTKDTNEVGPTLEISHEELIRAWDQVGLWLKDAPYDPVFQKRISEDTAAWMLAGKRDALLYQGEPLKKALVWAETNELNIDEEAFIEASTTRQNEQERKQKSARRRENVNRFMPIIAVILLVILVVSDIINAHQFINLPVSVTNLNDHGAGSLREAIANARPGSVIVFAPALKNGTITLTSGELTITKSLTIDAQGVSPLTIKGGNANRIFYISKEIAVSLSYLTLEGGNAAGSHEDITPGYGGSIYSDSNTILSLDNMNIMNNKADISGGGIYNNAGAITLTNSNLFANIAGSGGGIYNAGQFVLSKSLILANQAIIGGGIYNAGNTFQIVNSTIARNRGTSLGGGIATAQGKISMEYTTIYQNMATSEGGGLLTINNASSEILVTNCIIAGNSAASGSDVQGSLLVYSRNLIQTISGAGLMLVNQSSRVIHGKSPELGALSNNGGPTQTYPLLAGSPAIDLISFNDSTCAQTPDESTDQRGEPRPQGRGCDLGAYEYASS